MIKYSFVLLNFLLNFSLHAENNHNENLILDNKLKVLPGIQWQDVDGNRHHLKDSNGKPRILHFWAAWCFPCREELPEMLKWKERNSDVLMIPLSLDERMAQAKYFTKKNKLNMSPLLFIQGTGKSIKIPALPYTIFIASDGTSVGEFQGIAPWQDSGFTELVRKKFEVD